MSPKNKTKVLIGGNVYTLVGDESEEYIQRVALYINNKLDDLKSSENGQLLNTKLMNIFLAINIADDYFKEKQRVLELERDLRLSNEKIADLEKEVRTLHHELENSKSELFKMHNKIEKLEEEAENYKSELYEYIETFESEEE